MIQSNLISLLSNPLAVSSSSADSVIAKGLTRKFGEFTAVDDLNLAVKKGEIFGFLGANGAGKTTAIRMFCGLLKPTIGEAWVDGLPISSRAELVKKRIGYMSQRFSLYDDLTISENFQLFAGLYSVGRREMRERRTQLLERLGLTAERNRLTRELPLGYKQRLALGCAIIHLPRVLFLDEPTGGVDPSARREFWDLIYDLADSGVTVFVTTHYMDEAEYCGRISIMKEGHIIALGAPERLKAENGVSTIQALFLKLAAL